ncbi:MAG: transposase [Spirochaetes bacterium]|jgi:transposase-like protein|nr:transposase [Spirochaetota bacterium]
MDQHLGYARRDPAGANRGNSRNGKSKKTIITEQEAVTIEYPRDRNGDCEPQIVKKDQRRFEGFDDKIILIYGRGMTSGCLELGVKDGFTVLAGAFKNRKTGHSHPPCKKLLTFFSHFLSF